MDSTEYVKARMFTSVLTGLLLSARSDHEVRAAYESATQHAETAANYWLVRLAGRVTLEQDPVQPASPRAEPFSVVAGGES